MVSRCSKKKQRSTSRLNCHFHHLLTYLQKTKPQKQKVSRKKTIPRSSTEVTRPPSSPLESPSMDDENREGNPKKVAGQNEEPRKQHRPPRFKLRRKRRFTGDTCLTCKTPPKKTEQEIKRKERRERRSSSLDFGFTYFLTCYFVESYKSGHHSAGTLAGKVSSWILLSFGLFCCNLHIKEKENGDIQLCTQLRISLLLLLKVNIQSKCLHFFFFSLGKYKRN